MVTGFDDQGKSLKGGICLVLTTKRQPTEWVVLGEKLSNADEIWELAP